MRGDAAPYPEWPCPVTGPRIWLRVQQAFRRTSGGPGEARVQQGAGWERVQDTPAQLGGQRRLGSSSVGCRGVGGEGSWPRTVQRRGNLAKIMGSDVHGGWATEQRQRLCGVLAGELLSWTKLGSIPAGPGPPKRTGMAFAQSWGGGEQPPWEGRVRTFGNCSDHVALQGPWLPKSWGPPLSGEGRR